MNIHWRVNFGGGRHANMWYGAFGWISEKNVIPPVLRPKEAKFVISDFLKIVWLPLGASTPREDHIAGPETHATEYLLFLEKCDECR